MLCLTIYMFAIASSSCIILQVCEAYSGDEFPEDSDNPEGNSESSQNPLSSSCKWARAPADGFNYRLCSIGRCRTTVGSFWKNGTVRFTKCNKHFTLARGYDRDVCFNGAWTSTGHQCIQCGKSPNRFDSALSASLINAGFNSSRGDFPWMAALYTPLDGGRWTQICGGTLVTPSLVLSAAHCFSVDGDKTTITAENMRVGIGKLAMNYSLPEPGARIHAVKQIVKPDKYLGPDHLFALDIGLIVLTKSVEVNSRVMPACIDWSGTSRPSNNEKGVLAGWGKTEFGHQSQTLKWTFQKFVTYRRCLEVLDPLDRRSLSPDKFCALDVDGGKPDRGDSGGGLTFIREGIHYVYGVVSTKPIGEDKNLRLFTDVLNDGHLTWLREQWRNLQEQKREGCVDNEECELDRVCMSGGCVNPCRDACSEDSFCQVNKHIVTCLQFEKVHRLESNPPGLHNFNYVFFPIPRNNIIRFKVKTGTEANIVLSRFAHHMNLPTREILIGVGGNTQSAIRENVYAGGPPGSQTVGILSPKEFRGFWIKSSGGLTAAGRENEAQPFVTWKDIKNQNFKFFGVSTYGGNGKWVILGAGCTHDDECETDRACDVEAGTCVDPCKGACGQQSFCNAKGHKPSCFEVPNTEKVITNTNRFLGITYTRSRRAPNNSDIRFKVKAANGVTVVLAGTNDISKPPFYEVVLGGAANSASYIQVNGSEKVVDISTPFILQQHVFLGFWIRVKDKKVDVGKEDEVYPFMSWRDPSPSFKLEYYSFATFGSSGEWVIYD